MEVYQEAPPSGSPSYGGAEDQGGSGYSAHRSEPEDMSVEDLRHYTVSQEELRVIKECNMESFLYRSVPLMGLLGLGTSFAIQRGYWKSHPRFGMLPKLTIALFAGYSMGRYSYRDVYMQRLMELPNSRLGAALRKKYSYSGPLKTGPSYGRETPYADTQEWDIDQPLGEPSQRTTSPRSAYPTRRPEPSSPSAVLAPFGSEPITSPGEHGKPGFASNFSETSSPLYFDAPATSPYSEDALPPSSPAEAPPPQRRYRRSPPAPGMGGGGVKNTYGDIWEE
ncbi:unnamed protein product [Cyprideis torosa]|uniref:Uncharacterized protein n=1 Tax=Cyprideis torosa TaxID=163714 RepID=A0A7R8ZPR5_9CRUS|nr:unnamed protein product [Cyprideis torosa]CAG0890436.1 unnamed protein product [Cyprideis torosa]